MMATILVALLLLAPPAALSASLSTAKQVSVRVERSLAVGPREARDAWLSYQWERGGGLPVVVWPQGPLTRRVAPLLLEETLETSGPTRANVYLCRYCVTDDGLLRTELEPGTHQANVFFTGESDDANSCIMSWDVTFETRQRRDLWQAVTEQVIGQAADNLVSRVATPLLYTRRMRLGPSTTVEAALEAWLDFFFDGGGGLPLPPPVPLERGDLASRTNRTRLIVPPGIRERIVSTDAERGEARYTVDNPGLGTYQVHTHLGRVRFEPSKATDFADAERPIDMVWQVEVRPLPGCRRLVQPFTELMVSAIAINLRAKIAEPDGVIEIGGEAGGEAPLLSIPKASWLGGLLAGRPADAQTDTSGWSEGHIDQTARA